MARLALCAVVGFLWERERISDEEALRCLRESEQRRGIALTETLNIISVGKKSRKDHMQEAQKRKSHVIRATPVVTKLPVSWNSVLVRQQRARQQQQQQNTSPVSTHHNTAIHDTPSHSNTPQHTLQATAGMENKVTKVEDGNSQVSWWSTLVGYTLGAMYSSYNGMINYVMGSSNDHTVSPEDDCDPDSIILTDPVVLAKKYLNRNKNNETVKLNLLFSQVSLQTGVANIITRVVETMRCYTGSPVSLSLFEDALVAADYDGRAILLPAGTTGIMQWSPQQYSSTVSIPSEKKVNNIVHDWKLVHHSNDTNLYVRPYQDTEFNQYRVVSRFTDITAVDFVEVQADPSLRQQWDSYTGKMRIVDKDDVSDSEVFYWEVKFPFPLSNRDYVFTRRCVVLPHSIITLSRSTQHPSVPPSRGCVRVDTYNSVMVVTADTSVYKDGFCFELIYVDDPKCNLPSSLSNWASSSGMIEFLAKVHSAALKKKELDSKL